MPTLGGYRVRMRVTTLVIVGAAAAGIGVGAYHLGHAVDGPARQLETVASMPAQAAVSAAEANLQTAVSAAAAYRSDHGTYEGLTTDDLRTYDNAIAHDVSVRTATEGRYCIESTAAGVTVSITGPAGAFLERRC